MSNRFAPFVVALEEDYWDRELVAHFPGREGKRLSQVEERLQDITDLRIKEMDEAGIDLQVLSHGAPGTQKMEAEPAVKLSRQTNDRLAEIVKANPKRFAAFGPSKVIISKIDEADSYGAAVGEAIMSNLPVSFVTTGQQIPDDLISADKDHLLSFLSTMDSPKAASVA